MEERVNLSPVFKGVAIALAVFGFAILIFGFFTQPERTWANYLLNSFYFLSLAIGASFFYAIQYISQSGWSSGFKRIPEAMFSFIPVAAVLFVLLYFGMHSLYHWTHAEEVANDAILLHKAPYLNVPFFFIRLVFYFALWIILTRILRKFSLKEDLSGGLDYFKKSEFYSKLYIFTIAFTFSMAVIDWVKSIDPHWFSTLFALKNLAGAILHSIAIMVLIILFLNSKKYLSFLNTSHLHDFNRYLFIFSIFYGYFWFSQFMLIWFANIPEETIYYHIRLEPQWRAWWIADIAINWLIPFMVLLPPVLSRKKYILAAVSLLLIVGHWIDMYVQVMPGAVGKASFGIIEIGAFLGFAGLFAFVVGTALSKAPLVARNHPYLEESLQHHF